MDKQNEGIEDIAKADDPGRNERVAAAVRIGIRKGLHNEEDVNFCVP